MTARHRNKEKHLMRMTAVLLATIVSIFTFPVRADTVPCAPSGDPAAGGHCAFIHQSRPESWLRGSAALETSTGVLTLALQLATDSKTAGPCGKLIVVLRDGQGSDLVRVTMGRAVCQGGKATEPAAIHDFRLQKTVPLALAQRTKTVAVMLEYSGWHLGPWNVNLQEIADAIRMLVIAVG
jgi:hypothetical protein